MFKIKEAPMVNNSNQVQITKDYSLFSSLEGNRNVNKLHVKRLKESMKKKYLFTVIIVNERMQIIDGQHRFCACKDLSLPIRYIIIDGYGLSEIQMLNANSKNWTSDDYMNGYCDLGYEDYLIYKRFKKKYNFGHSECQSLLSGTKNTRMQPVFNSGEFKIVNFKKACKYADSITLLSEFYTGYKRRSFVFAMINVLDKKDFSIFELIKKLKIQPTALVDCVNVSQYVLLIEDIYNYKRRNKLNLRY